MNLENKSKIVNEFSLLTAQHALFIFKALKLEIGFNATVEDEETKEQFKVSFHRTDRANCQQAIMNKLTALSQSELDDVYCFIDSIKNPLPTDEMDEGRTAAP